jgi:dihydrofolate synthase / folylpolyglutamate synthase
MTAHFPSLTRLESLSPRGMKLGLAAIDAVCERLGRPERRVPSVLIAGTNGKGSTAAALSAIARVSGLRAGLYTSPHLSRVTERLRIAEGDVAQEDLERALARVFDAADSAPEVPVTYFEALTAAAFLAFADFDLDLSILEVGLGGRLDATNLAPARLSVVTSISLDHTEDLGPTVASIAREKAGIFRRGRPALVASAGEEAGRVFRDVAGAVGADLHEMAREVTIDVGRVTLEGTTFRLSTPAGRYALSTPLRGVHQAVNAATAVRAAELLSPEIPILREAIARGLQAVRWPGRLERFALGGRSVWLDGCHNPEGAAALAAFLKETDLTADLIFGAMMDKDIESMARELSGAVEEVRLVPVASERAASPEELRRRVAPWFPEARACRGLAEALEELGSRPEGKSIIVAGSLYLVGEARDLLRGGTLERTHS